MERDDTLVGSTYWGQRYPGLISGSPEMTELEPAELLAVPQPALLDPETAKAIRALCWTLCWLLWLASAIAVLLICMIAVAVVQGSLPG